LGGIMLGTAGHPGAPGAEAAVLVDYAPPPPALQVHGDWDGTQATVSCLVAPECSLAVLERSSDDISWKPVAELEPSTVPGPPGPKKLDFTDPIEAGVHMRYRVVAHSGERVARPSAVVAVSASAADGGKEEA
ncbi:MAG: hypothetical protein ACOCXJ_03125, partial [Planctomycetota bacterium]